MNPFQHKKWSVPEKEQEKDEQRPLSPHFPKKKYFAYSDIQCL